MRSSLAALALVVIAALLLADLASDLGSGASAFHVAAEGTAVVAAAFGVVELVRQVRHVTREAQELRTHLATSRADAERWRGEAGRFIEGLGAAIDRQLERWGLSAAEKEIALLLLKGLGHKEIAVIRDVSETTVRQQARAIYRKAGLAGRHELAAFFLEDLLEPQVTAADRASAS
ncbi:MAG: LuxR C-terminal-related transcriptional regulator [Acidobacteriota bacterium]